MLDIVESTLNKYNLTNKNNILLIGLSGGADSVCLSDIVYQLSKKYGFELILCHLNHNWRGEHSVSDMEFCINYANERNLKIITKALSKDEKQTETNARELRYKFFEQCKKDIHADAILLAHNKNDKIETLIYRIIKGTGIKGLSSIRERRDCYIRPLISISREEIENYCKKNNLEYVTDSTNFDNNYNRNYIRNEILPKFDKINSKYQDAVYNLSVLAEDEENLLEELINKIEKKITKNNIIITDKFTKLSSAIQKRILLNIYTRSNIDYDLKRINEVLEFIENNKDKQCGSKTSLTTNLWLFVSKTSIEIIKKVEKVKEKVNINKEGEYKLGKFIFKIEKCEGDTPKIFPNDSEMKAYVEIKEPLNFTLRTREEGDIIQPLGLKGTQKLKKYLNEKKVKQHEKDNLIFLCKENEILWAPPYGLNDKIKVVSKPNYVLSLYEREEGI